MLLSESASTPQLGKPQIQKAIAAAFKGLDPSVPERAQHFAWVDKYPDLNPVGWWANIQDMQPAQGGVMVELRLSPIFGTRSKNVSQPDHCTEVWLFGGKGLQRVPSRHVRDPEAAEQLVTD